jgi:hypothetical protein
LKAQPKLSSSLACHRQCNQTSNKQFSEKPMSTLANTTVDEKTQLADAFAKGSSAKSIAKLK